jgi:hypothetical protein
MAANVAPVRTRRQRVWLRVLLPDALVVIGAPLIELWSWNHLPGFRDLGYVLGLGSLVVFTFYGIWSYERTVRDQPGAIAMRDAIAATVIVLYLVLLSWAVFFSSGASTNKRGDGRLGEPGSRVDQQSNVRAADELHLHHCCRRSLLLQLSHH